MIRLQQHSFLGGQLDYEMLGRQDVQKYAKGATRLKNFNIQKRGGIEKRAGFDRVVNLRATLGINASTKIRIIPYAYRKTQGFVLVILPSQMYVVSTNPQASYKVYSVSNSDNIYSSDEIDELDYQQCGDVIFLAHQNHPPSKIEHIIDDVGEHGFHFEVMDVHRQKNGVPEITGAVIRRAAVKASGGTYTEEYKVSAVFDGVETFPCTAYKNTGVVNESAQWNGTTYYLPWTDSQKLTLTIKPNFRLSEDGATREYPSEIRVYKKAFNYFGLIGVVKVNINDAQKPLIQNGGSTSLEKYENSDISAETSIFDEDADNSNYGNGRTSHKLRTLSFDIDDWGRSDAGHMVIGLGSVFYTIGIGEVVFNYKGWTATTASISFGENTKQFELPSSGGDKTERVAKEEGETDDDFNVRWRDAYAAFCNSITDVQLINVDLPATDGDTVTISSLGDTDHFVFNSVKVFCNAKIPNVTFSDNYITPASDKTPPEYDKDNEVFSGDGNYPAAVSLTQQRLVWASSKNDPARIWLSQVGDFYTYNSHEIQTPDDAIDFIMPVTRFAKINHIAEMRKLLMFNSACEWLVDSASTASGITYETIQAYPQSYSGSSERLKPIICNNSLIFCERTGQSVRRFSYDISNDGFAGRDVSILSSSIFENNNIVDWTYQQFPYSTLWCVLADGTVASFEFMEEQDIMAWAIHEHGGGKFKAIATSYAVSPALDEIADVDAYENATHEEIFAVVAVGDEVWLERMRVRAKKSDSVYHALCMDSVRILNGNNPPLSDEGLSYVPHDTTDGRCISRDEAIRLIDEGKTVYEGYLFTSEYISVFPTFPVRGDIQGVGQMDIKNICNIALRLGPSFGGTVASYNFGIEGSLKEAIRYSDNPAHDCSAVFKNGRVDMFDCDCPNVKPEGMNTRDGRVKIEQREPWGFRVLMYEIDFEAEIGGWNGR